MTKMHFLAALPLVLSLTVSATAQQLPREGGKQIRSADQIVVTTAPRPQADPLGNIHFE
jgi:hypothetical protein